LAELFIVNPCLIPCPFAQGTIIAQKRSRFEPHRAIQTGTFRNSIPVKEAYYGPANPIMVCSSRLTPYGSHDILECAWMPYGDLGEHLSIQLYVVRHKAFDELGVGDAFLPACGIDTHNPQSAEIALSIATVPICVGARVYERLFGGLVPVASCSTIALRLRGYFLMPATPGNSCRYASHLISILPFGRLSAGSVVLHRDTQQLADGIRILLRYPSLLGDSCFSAGTFLGQVVSMVLTAAHDFSASGYLESGFRAAVTFHLRHDLSVL